MALTGTSRGQGSTNTAGETSLAVTPASNLAAGSLAVLCVAYDNSGSGGSDPFSSISDNSGAGNVWTSRQAPLNDPGAANAGHVLRIFTCRLKAALTTSHAITVSFGGTTTVARSWVLHEVAAGAGSGAVYQTGGNSTGSSGTPSITTGSITNGDMVIGAMGAEGNSAITGDSDTTNGSWSTQQTSGVGTTTGGSEITSQRKVVTATAAQTYNVSMTSADWCIAWIQIREIADTVVTPGTASLSVSSFAPIASSSNRLIPATQNLSLTAFAPRLPVPTILIPSTASLTLSSLEPVALSRKAADAFTDTNGTNATAHTPDLGGAWLQPSYGNVGQAFINSNTLTKDGNADQAVLYSNTIVDNSQSAKIRLRMNTSIAVNAGVVARLDPNSDNYYALRHNQSANEVQLRDTVNAVASSLGTWSLTLNPGDEVELEIRCIGNQIYGIVNGIVRIGPITNNSHQSGRVGIRFGGAASSTTGYAIDDFQGASVLPLTSVTVIPDTATLAASRFAPTASVGIRLTPDATAIATARFAPKLIQSTVPSTTTFATAGFAPRLHTQLTPPTSSLTQAAFAPTVIATDQVTVTPDTLDLFLTSLVPYTGRPFPATGLLDDLNRADEDPASGWTRLHTSDSDLRIVDNQIAGPINSRAVFAGLTPANDQEAYVDISAGSVSPGAFGNRLFLLLRITGETSDDATGYYILANSSVVRLFRIDSFSSVEELASVTLSAPLTAGDKIGGRVVGDFFEIWANIQGAGWDPIATGSDSTYPSGKIGVGVGSFDDELRLDNFSGGSLATAQVVTPTTSTLLTTTFAPALVRTTVLTPVTFSISISAFAPSVVQSNRVVPPSTAISITTFAPTLSAAQIPQTKSLVTTAFVPRLVAAVEPPMKALATSMFTPRGALAVIPQPRALSLSSFAPREALSIIPPTRSVLISSAAPVALAPRVAVPATASFATVKFAPQLLTTVIPPTRSLITSPFAPTALGHSFARPGIISLQINAFEPALAAALTIDKASLFVAGLNPVLATAVEPGTKNLTETGLPPVLAASVQPNPTALVTMPFSPTIVAPQVSRPGTKAIALTGFAPSPILPGTTEPATAVLLLNSFVAEILNPRAVKPGQASLQISFSRPTLVQEIPVPSRVLASQFFSPTIAEAQFVTPQMAALQTAFFTPALVEAILVGRRSLALSFTTSQLGLSLSPAAETLVTQGFPVVVSLTGSGDILVTPQSRSLLLVAFAPAAVKTGHIPLMHLPRTPLTSGRATALAFVRREGAVRGPADKIGGVEFQSDM